MNYDDPTIQARVAAGEIDPPKTVDIQVGDYVKVKDLDSFQMMERWSKSRGNKDFIDMEQIHVVKHVTTGYLGFTDDPGEGWRRERFFKVVPKAVSEERSTAINTAVNNIRFLSARQQAWDSYVESRRKRDLTTIPNASRQQGFEEGFNTGFLAGILAEKTRQQEARAAFFKQRPALARMADPETSHVAAKRVKGQSIANSILALMNGGHYEPRGEGWTGKELSKHLGIPLNSITPRFAGLKRAGLIYVHSGRGGETVWKLGNGVL